MALLLLVILASPNRGSSLAVASLRPGARLSLKEDHPNFHRAVPVVEPDLSHTKLTLTREGLAAIARIKTPVSIIAVIGPYRSGKSFLLNQLLGLSCNEGFGVGHMRDTKTKGIWVWGEPLEVEVNGVLTSVFFLDTEGFESIGKSTVYDDRIFALAAILSSVLIYNLPETVKEADIAKLSFAVELAEEFYGRVKGRDSMFEPARLLWLIQRDFLEGITVKQMVDKALLAVPNPGGDPDIEQVNSIRQSLTVMGGNSSAFGLTQPHLARTKLCDIPDEELDPKYLRQRDELRAMVAAMVAPKVVQGRTINGEEFVQYLEQTLEALNKGKIPSAGSVVDVFNRGVVERVMAEYGRRVAARLKLPAAEARLLEEHGAAARAAREAFEQERFGRKPGAEALRPLEADLVQALEKLKAENAFQSGRECERLYAACEDQLDYLENMRLPSLAKFDAGYARCNRSAEAACFGPSKEYYQERLKKMWTRERTQFLKDYNQRLFNWLVVFSLVMVAVARFVLRWTLVELCAWALFVFLETYTRIFWSVEGLYYNPAWRVFVGVWEAIVFNPVCDLDTWAIPLAWLGMISIALCRCYWVRRKRTPSQPILPLFSPGSRPPAHVRRHPE